MADLIADRDDLKTEEARLQKEIDGKTMLMGQLQRDEDQNNEKVEMRNMRLKNLASELKLAGKCYGIGILRIALLRFYYFSYPCRYVEQSDK